MTGTSNQSTRTSPGSYSTTQRTPSVSSGASPPHQSLSSLQAPSKAQNAMPTDVYHAPAAQAAASLGPDFGYSFSPLSPSSSFDNISSTTSSFDTVSSAAMRLGDPDRSAPGLNGFIRHADAVGGGAIYMRKLPKNTSREALRSMFLFSNELLDADFVHSDLPEDNGFLSAIARFSSMAAAEEARALLDGKPNSKNDATMIVEIYNSGAAPHFLPRRNTIDHSTSRGLLGNGPTTRQSRFNGTFQTMEKLSSTNPAGQSANEGLPQSTDTNPRLHNFFSPQSPIGNGVPEFPRISGKSMIDQDVDEDTGELLKDPVGYAENGHSASAPRRSTNPQIPTSHFANLSLTTNITSPPMQNYPSGSSAHMTVQTPSSAYPPSMNNTIGGPAYPYPSAHTARHSFPAANPNDMNPPCNTLYVGNLPPDTQEEELKALFSKQRGYKRLCFRNKQNGPMCFVEFEDVRTAGKTLNELYGYKLSNSIKTGIRLSFSKNPLGVRSGQPGSLNASNSLASQAAIQGGGAGINTMANHMFSTVSGPPPGLAAPPGLMPPMPLRNNGVMHPSGYSHAPMPMNGSFNPNAGLGIRGNPMNPVMMPPQSLLNGGANGGNAGPRSGNSTPNYPDYMMGR
ncbi:uncharacterized protein BJX67DRAFT_63424 [Aspergillus lucknowensis]|uniref:RRM domain-containing protein n=1 Tax=Aspergillus lucknowensis TaxID=176173 RepID=A0ABR4LUF8_9EURO